MQLKIISLSPDYMVSNYIVRCHFYRVCYGTIL